MDVKQTRKEMGGKLFNNKALAWLTLTHPALIIPLDLVMIVAFFYLAYYYQDMSILYYWWVFLLGILAWTFLEYLMHRFTFHFDAKKRKREKDYLYVAWDSSRPSE